MAPWRQRLRYTYIAISWVNYGIWIAYQKMSKQILQTISYFLHFPNALSKRIYFQEASRCSMSLYFEFCQIILTFRFD